MATTKAPSKEKEQIKRPDLKISIKDFGPIAEGEIELKPLTVFIGPNNSGKSYAAMLMYSIFKSIALSSKTNPVIIEEHIKLLQPKNQVNKTLHDLGMKLQNLISADKIDIDTKTWQELYSIDKNDIDALANDGFRLYFENEINKVISSLYSCPLNHLVMIGKSSFSLDATFNSHSVNMSYQEDKLVIKEFCHQNQSIETKVAIDPSSGWMQVIAQGKSPGRNIQMMNDPKQLLYGVVSAIYYISAKEMFEKLNISCYYFPASRTGILQLYKGFSANVIKQQEIPKLSGIVSDFISTMIGISDKEKGFYYQFAEELSMELLKGDIILVSKDENLIPEIRYRFKGVDLPLYQVSTSVSELAPLILYLKYIVQPGSVLIIEEPEAHLHPGNIRVLAKYLVRLVKKGVNVLITTHSDYLLEQINNFYLLSKKTPEERVENYKYDENDFIKSDELGVYEFHYDEEAKGYKIRQAEIDEDGILEREIYNTTEALYEETSQLQREFDDEE